MATYAVSFTLKYDDDYSDRYDSLMQAIRAKGTAWTGTTAFALVETSETMAEFEFRLYLSKFSSSKDTLIVVNVSNDPATCRGAITDKVKLLQVMPGITQK